MYPYKEIQISQIWWTWRPKSWSTTFDPFITEFVIYRLSNSQSKVTNIGASVILLKQS